MQKENIRMDQNEENIKRHTVDVVAKKEEILNCLYLSKKMRLSITH